jgi:hypothetical protein
MLTDMQNAASLVKRPADEFTVEAGMIGIGDLLDHKIEIFFQKVPGRTELFVPHAHDDHFVDRL